MLDQDPERDSTQRQASQSSIGARGPVLLWAPVRRTFGPALVASAISVVLAYGARLLFGIPTSAEVLGDRLTLLIPLPVFSRLLSIFGSSAKHWYFGMLTIAGMLLTAGIGSLYYSMRAIRVGAVSSRLENQALRRLTVADAVLIAALLYLLSATVLAPAVGGGLFGASLPGGVPGMLASQLISDGTFAILLVVLQRRASAATDTTVAAGSVGRRRFIREAAVALGVLIGGGLTWELLASGAGSALGLPGQRRTALTLAPQPTRIVPPPEPMYGAWAAVAGQTPEVTTASGFYYVSKNLVGDPSVDPIQWRLQIGGKVNSPYSLSLEELRALPQVERYHTLECISNDVGGGLMSNARFTGVRLADLLDRAGIQSGTSEVIFQAADGYSDRLHLVQALDPRSLVVYLLNGQPLPQAHGYPARLLIPGLYGMKNGKWLTSLEVSSGDYTGYWEARGWTREAVVKLTSRIDMPHDGDLLVAGPIFVAGVAYGGDKGIARVDVSTDGGRSWQPAGLKRPLGPLTWVLWEFGWTATSGQHVLAVRAIDLDGNVQTPAEAPPLPDGASGYDSIGVVVR